MWSVLVKFVDKTQNSFEMQSFGKPQIICGVLLLLATIGSAMKKTSEKINIEQISEPSNIYKSPFWDHEFGKLYASEYYTHKLVCLNVATGKLTYAYIANKTSATYLGPAVLVEGTSNQFVVGSGADFMLLTWDSDTNSNHPSTKVFVSVDTDKPGNQINDGRVDSRGRFWAGTKGAIDGSGPAGITPNKGSLYRLSGRNVEREISPVNVSDGLAWNKEYTIFYFIDSASYNVVAYDFDADQGEISNKRVAIDFTSQNISGLPDGMTVDTDGNLWVAMYGSGNVIKVDPVKGELLQTIEMPTTQVVGVTFGGPMFDTLYVTSRFNPPPAVPEAGSASGAIFAVTGLGVRGFAANKFSLNNNHYQLSW